MQDSSNEQKIKVEDEPFGAETTKNSNEDSNEEPRPNQRDAVKSSVVEEKEDAKKSSWVPGKSWCWHLAEDGTPLTVLDATATGKKDQVVKTEAVDSGAAMETTTSPTKVSSNHQDLNRIAAADDTMQPTGVDPSSQTKRKRSGVIKSKTVDDGATTDTTRTPTEAADKHQDWNLAAAAADDGMQTQPTGVDAASQKKRKTNDGSPLPTTSCKVETGDGSVPQPGGWHWILNSDGSPATVDALSEVPWVAGKRNRGIQRMPRPSGHNGTQATDNEPNHSDIDSECYLSDDDSSSDSCINYDDDNDDDDYSNCDSRSFLVPSEKYSVSQEQNWERKFQLLVEYKNKHKTTVVPLSDPTLGKWIKNQRRAYRQRTMSKYRVQRLNSLGFVWKAGNETWEEKFQLLVQYKKQHGNLRVPRSDPILGRWVHHQRTAYKEKKMTKNRVQRLESIGFEWKIIDSLPWIEMYKLLTEYKSQYGSTCVPQGYKPDPKLGTWVTTQRSHYHKGELSNKRIALLESVGFQWKLLEVTPWIEMYERLKEYKSQCGSTLVPQSYKADPKLGLWVSTQRRYCKEKYRVDLLNKIGFEWGKTRNDLRNDWEVMYQRLLAYKKKNGTTRVPKSYKADPKLARWVSTQRTKCKEKYRVDLLNKIDFVWDVRDTKRNDWEVMYQRLLAYKKNNGTTCVPRNYKADPKLGNWVSWQRRICKEKYRIDLLNKIGFEWGKTRNDLRNDWEVMYQRLLAYKKNNGTTCVPQQYREDPKLGKWVSRQRRRCKEKYRVDLLNKIGFVWDARF